MTAQDVIKAFVAKLASHGYSYSDSVGTSMLDSAVRASSRFSSIQDVINAMKADQIAAEKEAVQLVLGSDYAGKTLAEIDESILKASAKNYDGEQVSNAYLNEWNDNRTTVEAVIKERKAYIFLEKYCGIQLAKKYWFTESGGVTSWTGDTTGNVDTGAITGSDANITLHSGDTDYYGNTINLSALATKYGLTLEEDGSLIIGTGTEKTDRSVVPETFINTYTVSTTAAQKIITDNRDWVVKATDADNTITSGGADSINAGAGNDIITVNGDGATVTSGEGSDNIEISAQVRDVAISDLTAEDTMTINGSFEIGAAKIEDMMLIITDKTGKRKLRLGDFTNATIGKLKIDGASMTIGQWLTNSGINLNNLETTTYAASVGVGSSNAQAPDNAEDNDGGRTAIDPEYTPTPLPESVKTTEPTLTEPSHSSNTNGNSPVTVNLANVNTSTAGNVEIDGQVVGTTSSTYPGATTFTRNGLTIHLLGTSSSTSGSPTDNGQSLITPLTLNDLTDDQKAIIAGLFKWWGAETINLNEDSYGIGFNSDTTMCKDIGLYFYDGQGKSNTLATVWNWQRTYTDGTGDGFAYQLMLNVNMDYYKNLAADDMDGTTSSAGAGFLDRTLSHEMNHAILASNVNFFGSLPKFIKEGIAELTHGIVDERTSTIFKIAYDAEELAASLDISNTDTGTQEKGDGYAGGVMFYRYLAKQAALQTLNLPAFGEITATVNLSGNGTYYITGNSTSETAQISNTGAIKLGTVQDGVYTVENSGVHQVINGSANIKIVGLTSNDTYNGTSGADTVETAEGSNIITGAGNDTIYQYSNSNGGNAYHFSGYFGDDSIRGFMSNDTIHIANGYTTEFANNVLTVKKDNGVKGTIKISGSFDATKNIVADLEEEVTVSEFDVTRIGQEVQLTDDADTIYIDASKFTQGGNVTLENSFGAADKIIVYWNDKQTVLSNFQLNLDNALNIGGTYNNSEFSIQINGGGFTSTVWTDIVNYSTTRTVTKKGVTTDSNSSIILDGKSEESSFTLTGIDSINGIEVNDQIVTVSTSNINNSTKTVTLNGNFTLAVTGDNVAEYFNALELDAVNNKVTYQSAGYGVGYYVENNQISYNVTATGGNTLLEISGVDCTQIDDNFINNSSVNLDSKYIKGDKVEVLNNAGVFTFNLMGDWSSKMFSGSTQSESININSDGLTLAGMSGKDTVSGSISTTKFIIGDEYTKTISGNDVVLTFGENSLTLKEAANLDTLTIDGSTVGIYFDIEDGKFLIKTADVLQALASYSTNHTTAGKTFKFTNNIAMPDNFTISNFSGTLDGDNHLITNVKTNPFGSGTIKNLYYHGTAEISGATRVYTLNLPSGVTATTTATPINFNDVDYYETGTTFELSGHFANMSVNNVTLTKLDKDKYSYTLGVADAEVTTTAYAAEFIANGTAWDYYDNGYLQFTVDGLVKAPTVDMVSGDVLTLTKDYLTTEEVTLTNATGESYQLALNSNVPTSGVETAGSFTKSKNGTATYKTTSVSDYYTLNGKKITYTAATGD
ncbi:MAG: hypothetical protein IJK81_06895 [Selenomonadaceae bacterium]|nr:hypothetical protein [Selenomonadaceae bacterium]